jgi:hypothetical protein
MSTLYNQAAISNVGFEFLKLENKGNGSSEINKYIAHGTK